MRYILTSISISFTNFYKRDMACGVYLLLLIITSGLCYSPIAAQEDPGIPDTVRIESVNPPEGATVCAVDVFLWNDESFSIPVIVINLKWDSPDLICDGVSYSGRIDVFVCRADITFRRGVDPRQHIF